MVNKVSIDADLALHIKTLDVEFDKRSKLLKESLEKEYQKRFEALNKKFQKGSLGNPSSAQITKMEKLNRLVSQFFRYAIGYSVLYKATQAVGALTRELLNLDEALFDIKAVSASTTEQMDSMEASIKRVATTTKFTISQIAQAGKVLAQTGLRGKDFSSALEATAQFASAVGASIDVAADLVTTMRQVFSEMSDTSISNLLTKAVNISKLTATDLKTILSLGTQTAKAYGLSAEQFFAAATTLRNAGIKASTVATGFRQALIEMFTLDNSAVKVLVARYKDIGETISEEMIRARFFSFTQSNNPLVAVLEELKRLGFAGSARQQFSRAFDVRAVNAILPLINRLDELRNSETELAFGNAAIEASRTQMESFNNASKNLGATIGALTDDIAGGLIPDLTLLVKKVTDVVGVFREWNLEMKALTGSGGEVTAVGGVSGALLGAVLGKGAAGKLAGALVGGAAGAAGGTLGAPLAAQFGIDSTLLLKTIANIGGLIASLSVIKAITGVFGGPKISAEMKKAKIARKGSKGFRILNIIKGGKSSLLLRGFLRFLGPVGVVIGVVEGLMALFDLFGSGEMDAAVRRAEAQEKLIQKQINDTREKYKEFATFKSSSDTATVGGQVNQIGQMLEQGKIAMRKLFGKDSVSDNTVRLMETLVSIGAEAGSQEQKRAIKKLRDQAGLMKGLTDREVLVNASIATDSLRAAKEAANSTWKMIKDALDTTEGERTTLQNELVHQYELLRDSHAALLIALRDSTADARSRMEAVKFVSSGVAEAGSNALEAARKRARDDARKIMKGIEESVLTSDETRPEVIKEGISSMMTRYKNALIASGVPVEEAARKVNDDMRDLFLTLGVKIRELTSKIDAQKKKLERGMFGYFFGETRKEAESKGGRLINERQARETSMLTLGKMLDEAETNSENMQKAAKASEARQTEALRSQFDSARSRVLDPNFLKVLTRAGEGAKAQAAIAAAQSSPVIKKGADGNLTLAGDYPQLRETLKLYDALTRDRVEQLKEEVAEWQLGAPARKRLREANWRLEELRREEGGLAAQGMEGQKALADVFTIRKEQVDAEIAQQMRIANDRDMDEADRKRANKRIKLLLERREAIEAEGNRAETRRLKAEKKYLDKQAQRRLLREVTDEVAIAEQLKAARKEQTRADKRAEAEDKAAAKRIKAEEKAAERAAEKERKLQARLAKRREAAAKESARALKAENKFQDEVARRRRDAEVNVAKQAAFTASNAVASRTAAYRAGGGVTSRADQEEQLRIQADSLRAQIAAQQRLAGRTPLTEGGKSAQSKAARDVEKLKGQLIETEAQAAQLGITLEDAIGQGFSSEAFINALEQSDAAVQNLGKTIQSKLVGAFNDVSRAIVDMAFEGKDAMASLSAIARNLVADLAEVLLRQQLIQLAGGIAGGFGGIGAGGGGGSAPVSSGLLDNLKFQSIGNAAGGVVSGPGTGTSDSIPARLSAGEGVLNAAAVQDLGRSFVHAANARAFKLASGGLAVEKSRTSGGGALFKPTVNISVEPPPGIPMEAEVAQSRNGQDVVLTLMAKQIENRIAQGVATGNGAVNQALEGVGVNRASTLFR